MFFLWPLNYANNIKASFFVLKDTKKLLEKTRLNLFIQNYVINN